MNEGLSHLDESGRVHMVDVGGKPVQRRRATATATVIRLYSAAKYPSRLDVAIDHSITESSADTTASSFDIGGNGAGGGGGAIITRV